MELMPKKVFIFGSYNPVSFQPETTAYLNAIVVPNDSTIYYSGTAQQITGSAIWTALDAFVVSVKNAFSLTLGTNNLSTKFPAIYPIIGGTATSHKYNLCDPQDTNGAFRLTFSGGWTHSKTGILGNGSNTFANTFITPSGNMSLNNSHIGFYSRTNSNGNNYVEMGIGGPPSIFIAPKYDITGNAYRAVHSAQTPATAGTINMSAYFQANRISSTTAVLYRNKTALFTDALNSTSLTNVPIYIGAYYGGGAYTNRECAFASIGIGMNATEQGNYYDAIQQLQTSLFRQV